MPDKKLTDKEILDLKELLEYKAKVGCQNCDLIGKGCCSTCLNSLIKQFIELFDRLQAENERLKETTKNMSAYVKGNRWGLVSFVEFCKNLKAKAYKECIEKVKAENYDRCIDVVYDGSGEVKRTEIRQALFNKQLDNLLKELVGEDNA